MLSTYKCKMVGYDDDTWHDVPSRSPLFAAQRHAAICDQNSGGALFEDEIAKQTVIVQAPDGSTTEFACSIFFEKVYLASTPD